MQGLLPAQFTRGDRVVVDLSRVPKEHRWPPYIQQVDGERMVIDRSALSGDHRYYFVYPENDEDERERRNWFLLDERTLIKPGAQAPRKAQQPEQLSFF